LDFDEVWPFSRTTKPRYSRALEFGEQGRGKRAAKVTDGGARGRILAARQPGVELGHKLLDRTSHPERAKAVELVVESASGQIDSTKLVKKGRPSRGRVGTGEVVKPDGGGTAHGGAGFVDSTRVVDGGEKGGVQAVVAFEVIDEGLWVFGTREQSRTKS